MFVLRKCYVFETEFNLFIINSLHEKRIQFKLLYRQLLTIVNLVTRYLIDIVYLFNIYLLIDS